MPLTPGARLGPYEIVAPLGAGGMGEVYRAKDTRLGRDVAVKVLPAHLSDHPEVRARFEREAKTVSSLNHPHICTLFDVGREGDVDFLVMELIEGETLADRLQRGPLPLFDVLRIGGQIADALDRAHRAGVIHRDLKPGNIMLTRSGAKLMDFGLARATGLGGASSGSAVTMAALTRSPTVAQPLTAEGTIVGTFQYMSPEQLEGKEADARSDLWALGCVLYEMATGKRAFDGPSQASLIAAIMHLAPPPVSQVVALSPQALDRLVSACLAKDPADRIQSAHDVKLQLGWMGEAGSTMSGTISGVSALPGAAAAPSRRSSLRGPVIAGISAALISGLVTAVISGLVTGTLRTPAKSSSGGSVSRVSVGSAGLVPVSTPLLTSDGESVIFAAREGSHQGLYRRRLSSYEITPIEGTDDASGPFISPDGAWIGYLTPTAIKKVPVDGGVAQTIATAFRIDAADWGRDGTIWCCPRFGGENGHTALLKVPAAGGTPTVVASIDTSKGESEGWLPEVLPDGKHVLFSVSVSGGRWTLVCSALDGTRRPLIENAVMGRYVSSGYLVYYDNDSQAALAAPFDPVAVKVTGAAVPLTERADGYFAFDVSENGRIVYVPLPGANEGNSIVWIDRQGRSIAATDMKANWTRPHISPDGKRALVRKIGDNCEFWLLDLERGTMSRALQAGDNHDMAWAPDGRHIAVQQLSPVRMITIAIDGGHDINILAEGPTSGSPSSWSDGGNRLVYLVNGHGTGSDIWVRDMNGPGPATPFLASESNETDAAITPDGNWIAYTSNEGGAPEVYIRHCPDNGSSWQVSTGGGNGPLWAHDGKHLHYASGTRMMSVAIERNGSLHIGTPVELFDGGFNTERSREFDEVPDGRFLAVQRSGGNTGKRELRMVMNWPALLAGAGAASPH